MAKMGFTLSMCPWAYYAQFDEKGWIETYVEKPHKSPAEEAALPDDQLQALLQKRNSFPELPLVNFTTQYGLGCFEGLKAFPQPDGSLRMFRPDENGKRMHSSMKGLMMPAFPIELFTAACREVVRRNHKLGFTVSFDPAWAKEDFVAGHSIYIRPFTYSEPGIGLNLSKKPWVVIVTTPVGSYFKSDNYKAISTDKIRAFQGGTGWIKCDANYVVPILAKKQAEAAGYMEAIFLDAREGRFVEEGSSCNIFFRMKSGTLVTPELGETILPGITRKSILQLARDLGTKTEERPVTIEEVLDSAAEAFVTGTAAGVTYIESITHKGRTAVFNGGAMGDYTHTLLTTLKGIQYGALPDKFGWMFAV
jgi:branched-chain amino acid aminotransferase